MSRSFMASHCPRRTLSPGGTRKRKERGAPWSPTCPPAATPTATAHSADAREAGEGNLVSSNRLLAGYMAHEFLTRGTLFGQKLDSSGAEGVPSATAQASLTRKEVNGRAEMASILKSDGIHIPGVVNPSQLCAWMQI